MSALTVLLAIAITAVVVAATVAVPLTVAIRFVIAEAGKARETAQARAIAQQTYITELQNRLMSHSWTDFAQLQNDVASPTGQTVAAINSFGEHRSEEAYGETAADQIESLLRDFGSDLEPVELGDRGPTIG